MDNGQIPVMPSPSPAVTGPTPSGPTMGSNMGPAAGMNPSPNANANVAMQGQPMPMMTPDGKPMMQQTSKIPEEKKTSDLVKTIVIIALSLALATFIGLFIWMYTQYNDERNRDLDKEIADAVSESNMELTRKLEAEFAEREKEEFKPFAGPVDYGSLFFKYPKTWSVYVAQAATAGGDFNAYFNPGQVDAVGKDTINALRVTILNKSFESVTEKYQKEVEGKNPKLSVNSVTVNNTAANRYTGTIPGTELEGIIVIFKIRDKTVIMQTDSMNFENDFNRVIESVTFNE